MRTLWMRVGKMPGGDGFRKRGPRCVCAQFCFMLYDIAFVLIHHLLSDLQFQAADTPDASSSMETDEPESFA